MTPDAPAAPHPAGKPDKPADPKKEKPAPAEPVPRSPAAAASKAGAKSPDTSATPAQGAPGAPSAVTRPAAKAPAAAPVATPTGDHLTLAQEFGAAVTGFEMIEDGAGVTIVDPDALPDVAARVKAMGYTVLSVLSAYDRGDHFGVLYAFLRLAESPAQAGEMRLRVVLPKKDGERDLEPACPTLCGQWSAANWHEREMYDMYGIRFEGHPDLRRMFLPEGWTGFPMRRDYKEPEQYVAMEDGEDIVLRSQQEGSW